MGAGRGSVNTVSMMGSCKRYCRNTDEITVLIGSGRQGLRDLNSTQLEDSRFYLQRWKRALHEEKNGIKYRVERFQTPDTLSWAFINI